MNWIRKNFKKLIYIAFLVPIFAVAIVSISHVTKWYGLSNPLSWAIYLSIGVEFAALSAVAAISAKMGKKVYIPFGIVTLIQFIGNVFFAYQYIDVDLQEFKDWVELVDPVVSYLGVESGDLIGHKRFLALFSGGMIPIISLSFLHMLVKFEEEDKNNSELLPKNINIDSLSTEAGKKEFEFIEEFFHISEYQMESGKS
jgi:phosphoglycerol transferase MdoB-like AlkP superfamily enzyme